MTRMTAARVVALGGLAVAVACGGSDDAELFGGSGGSAGSGTGGTAGSGTGGSSGADAGVGGSAGSATGGSAGSGTGGSGTGGSGTGGSGAGGSGGSAGAPVDAGPEWTLDNVCQKLPALTCQEREACCVKSGAGYDQAECIKRETESCASKVEQVKSGARTFNPDRIPQCLAAVQPLLGACLFSGDQWVAYLKATNLCNSIFDSKSGPGSPCSTSSDCAAAPPGGYSGCGSQSHQCYQGAFAQNGGPCNNAYCDEGLTCIQSQCTPKVPLNGPCSSSSQCGYGAYCPQVSGQDTCKPGLPGGATCYSDLWCLSLDCSNYKCVPQGPYVRQEICGT